MIDANKEIFGGLDKFCSSRGDPIRNAGKPRWIGTTEADRQILQNAVLTDSLKFGQARAIARFDRDSDCYFCTLGLDYVAAQGALSEIDLDAGLLTALLSELRPRPRATTTEIRNIVEAIDRDADAAYPGHDAAFIASLFAPIKVLSSADVVPDDTWRIFFSLCIEECKQGDSWIDEEFAITLQAICELELISIPYQTLCRSIFDSDPAAMFL